MTNNRDTIATIIGALVIIGGLAFAGVLAIGTFVTSREPSGGRTSSPQPGFVSRSDFGEKWPLTVDAGVLQCSGSAVTLTVGAKTFALNGRARGMSRFADIASIVKPTPPGPYTPLTALAEEQRREIFARLVDCEDRGGNVAACRAALRKRHRITIDDARLITEEGTAVPWPPLTATRMDVSPLIAKGLALCR